MKPKYAGYEAKKHSSFIELPPSGAYIGKILNVKVENSYDKTHDQIVLMLDITEGEYKGRYMEVYNDQKERFPDCKYRGVFRITVPENEEPPEKAWIRKKFEENMWAVEQSNEGYAFDWDENKLKDKKVGFSVRKRLYTGRDRDGNPVDRETFEICQLESIEEVKDGKVKPMPVRDTRTVKTETDDSFSGGTDVTGSVEVPF